MIKENFNSTETKNSHSECINYMKKISIDFKLNLTQIFSLEDQSLPINIPLNNSNK